MYLLIDKNHNYLVTRSLSDLTRATCRMRTVEGKHLTRKILMWKSLPGLNLDLCCDLYHVKWSTWPPTSLPSSLFSACSVAREEPLLLLLLFPFELVSSAPLLPPSLFPCPALPPPPPLRLGLEATAGFKGVSFLEAKCMLIDVCTWGRKWNTFPYQVRFCYKCMKLIIGSCLRER